MAIDSRDERFGALLEAGGVVFPSGDTFTAFDRGVLVGWYDVSAAQQEGPFIAVRARKKTFATAAPKDP